MLGKTGVLGCVTAALQFGPVVLGAATWPSPYDELEDIMLLNEGYRARKLALPVTPCNFQANTGFIPAAGFLRAAFHDVAGHNSATGVGGLDASIAFELTGEHGADNAGPFANNTLTFLSRYYSTEASMADLMALATYTAVRGCGGPVIPIKTGRKDAQQAGPLGVPKVTATQQTHVETFSRIGFNKQEMIKLVACGHTLGGVHKNQFPAVVANGTTPSNVENFDSTEAKFDNRVAVEFVSNTTKNPLVVGPSNAQSDKKIFESDGGNTIKQLTDAQTFQNECKVILQKMLEVVPSSVSLTEPIQVYDVKPGSISLSLSGNGTLHFNGEIRVRTTAGQVGSVTVVPKNSAGLKGNSTISTTLVGTGSGHDDSFAFYSFSTLLDIKTSISAFDVIVTGADGNAKTYNNNGKSFPVQDSLFVHHPSCGLSTKGDKTSIKVIAAVRGSASSVSLTSTVQQARDVPLPLLSSKTITMKKASTLGDFTFYKGTFEATAQQLATASFDISVTVNGKKLDDKFHKIAGFGNGAIPGDNKGDDGADDDDDDHNGGGNGDWINIPGGSNNGGGNPNRPYTPSRPCGEFEACDSLPWAGDLPAPDPDTYAPPGSHGAPKPGSGSGSKPGSSNGGGQSWGGNGNDNGNGNGHGSGDWIGYPHVPVGPSSTHSTVGGPIATPKPVGSGNGIGTYTGAASNNGASSAIFGAALLLAGMMV